MEFSDLALAKFLQTASELSPYILNFSLIDDESGVEGSQVGVFILSTPSGIAYVPVIGKGDTTFPIDSIFLEEEKRFIPLTKATISKLINSPAMALGKTQKIPDSVVRNPDMSHLINPPRTGKYVYASASRLTEFMASLPQDVKEFAFEKIAAEHSLFTQLDKMFGLKAIFAALKSPLGTGAVNASSSGPRPIVQSNPSVITSAQEIKSLADEALAAQFLLQGYAVVGNPEFSRTAVAYAPYNQMGQFQSVSPSTDGGRDYTIVLNDGNTKQAFLPKYAPIFGANHREQASLLEDGNFVMGPMIAVGDGELPATTLRALFEVRPPKLLRDCFRDDTIMLFNSDGDAIGPFKVGNLILTPLGAEAQVYPLSSGSGIRKICAFNNVRHDVNLIGDTLYVRHNVIVLPLGIDMSHTLETSPNMAATRRELITSQFLGAEMDIRHDGVEYSANGRILGSFPNALKVLVEDERLDPEAANSFLKQASELRHVRIFLSKKASADSPAPTEIPRYGNMPDTDQTVGMNGAFMPAVQQAAGLGDGQVLEATVISQLLQSPNLLELVGEYLPDLQSATDKLGRVLFLSRVKMDQLSESLDSDSVFALINQIKTVYRTLGDATTKLEETFNASAGFVQDDGNPANTGV